LSVLITLFWEIKDTSSQSDSEELWERLRKNREEVLELYKKIFELEQQKFTLVRELSEKTFRKKA